MSVITKYSVYSTRLKQFWGKTNYEPIRGDDSGFVPEVEHAKLYSLDHAERMAEDMFDTWTTIVVPIRIVMNPVFRSSASPQDVVQAKKERFRALAKEFDEMSMEEADRLSKTKLSQYRLARQFVKDEERKEEK